jgi:hypothetical protein
VYFGPLGANRATKFVEYMETLPRYGLGPFPNQAAHGLPIVRP